MNFRGVVQTLLRRKRQVEKSFYLYVYARVNRRSCQSIVNPGGPVVSLTTYGERTQRVYLAIESIGRGRLLPSRMILWLDDANVAAHLPVELERLQSRGLEIKVCPNYGPHKKYYPYVESQNDFEAPLVTADDDIFYPRQWLRRLYDAYLHTPEHVHCFRARRMHITCDGIAPYASWEILRDTRPSYLNLATGCAGIIYPEPLLRKIKQQGTAFRAACPRADDLWLHVQALRAGYRVHQIVKNEFFLCEIPGTQANALYRQNFDDGNDRQIQTTYGVQDLELLQQEAEREHSSKL